MKLVDDRTEEQCKTHTWLVVMTDRFMSGWGEAEGGVSYAAWACKYENLTQVKAWVRSRSDAMRVRVVTDGTLVLPANANRPSYTYKYRPKGTGHCHIYVVNEGHASLASCANCGR